MKNSLILVRGIPGSGKTTFAKTVAMGSPVIAADDFFMVNGFYVFNKSKLGVAHKWCQNTTRNYMEDRQARIFVANTFTTKAEMAPYFDLAKKHGYSIFSIIVENRHGHPSIHNVPEESIDAMKNRFDVKI